MKQLVMSKAVKFKILMGIGILLAMGMYMLRKGLEVKAYMNHVNGVYPVSTKPKACKKCKAEQSALLGSANKIFEERIRELFPLDKSTEEKLVNLSYLHCTNPYCRSCFHDCCVFKDKITKFFTVTGCCPICYTNISAKTSIATYKFLSENPLTTEVMLYMWAKSKVIDAPIAQMLLSADASRENIKKIKDQVIPLSFTGKSEVMAQIALYETLVDKNATAEMLVDSMCGVLRYENNDRAKILSVAWERVAFKCKYGDELEQYVYKIFDTAHLSCIDDKYKIRLFTDILVTFFSKVSLQRKNDFAAKFVLSKNWSRIAHILMEQDLLSVFPSMENFMVAIFKNLKIKGAVVRAAECGALANLGTVMKTLITNRNRTENSFTSLMMINNFLTKNAAKERKKEVQSETEENIIPSADSIYCSFKAGKNNFSLIYDWLNTCCNFLNIKIVYSHERVYTNRMFEFFKAAAFYRKKYRLKDAYFLHIADGLKEMIPFRNFVKLIPIEISLKDEAVCNLVRIVLQHASVSLKLQLLQYPLQRDLKIQLVNDYLENKAPWSKIAEEYAYNSLRNPNESLRMDQFLRKIAGGTSFPYYLQPKDIKRQIRSVKINKLGYYGVFALFMSEDELKSLGEISKDEIFGWCDQVKFIENIRSIEIGTGQNILIAKYLHYFLEYITVITQPEKYISRQHCFVKACLEIVKSTTHDADYMTDCLLRMKNAYYHVNMIIYNDTAYKSPKTISIAAIMERVSIKKRVKNSTADELLREYSSQTKEWLVSDTVYLKVILENYKINAINLQRELSKIRGMKMDCPFTNIAGNPELLEELKTKHSAVYNKIVNETRFVSQAVIDLYNSV
ncbi:hypothetical protein ENBRE01_2181 [Enteropsectra breve]|nr:hypothetical protein ENBRE01_2181 [Enteropsectra breve]